MASKGATLTDNASITTTLPSMSTPSTRATEIIKAARNNGPNLNELLKTPLSQLEDGCLNSALLAAVENSNPVNLMKLILRGASNTDEALAKSRNLRQHTVTAALLIIKAAMVNDRVLIMKLYSENVHGQTTKIPLTREDDLAALQAAVASNSIKTVIPIEISRRNNASAVRKELLLRTGVDKNSGMILWFGLRLLKLEISWLRKIFWVKTLKLARNEITSVPQEMGNYLKQCIELDLQWNKLREIPPSLLELPSLNKLNLSHNDLVNIPDVPEWSASLVVLDLSYNRLSNLPNSAIAPTLKNLNINDNRFRGVPHCVCSFISLTTLNIANNSEIISLPSELGRLKNLLNLNLDGLNDLNDPPRSVCTTTKDCIKYLSSKLHSSRGYYHMKMMLVGKQAIGKTTLVARLKNNNKEIGNKSTVGIDVTEWKYSPAYNKKTFHFSIWDFAGGEVYHATHQCFLSEHSLYLLVWKVTEGEAGIADLRLWLNNISARAPNSHIIIVGTFLDEVSEEDKQSDKVLDLLQKVVELTDQYHRLVVYKVTVVGLKGHIENMNKLKDDIYNAAAEYKVKDQCIMGRRIPSSYHALDNKLSTIHRLVKEGKHEPIMHTSEFQKMVRDLDLVDLQDDDELRTVTFFLHEVGALLHYDDRKNNLDDLYFVDPCWLCDLMSTVVTVKERNPFVKQGILRSKNIPLLFKDKRFPYKYFNQYLTLLNRFEIALPLDKDYSRVLIPSMLSKQCPEVVTKLQPDYNSCYKRFILFHEGRMLHCSTPPGLWSRLLFCIMSTFKEVKDTLSEQIPFEDNDTNFTNVHYVHNITTPDVLDSVSKDSLYQNAGNGVASQAMSNFSTNCEGPLESISSQVSESVSTTNGSQKVSDGGSVEVFPVEGGGSLVYWSTGLVYNTNELIYSIESLEGNAKYHDKDGILILASLGTEGRNILCQMIDIVEKIVSEFYPGLSYELEHTVPCSECLKIGIANPHEFKVDKLLPVIAEHKLIHKCGYNHEVQLVEIVPDLLLADLNSAFLLDFKELLYEENRESAFGTGAFGEVHWGKYKNRPVSIKLYKSEDSRSIMKSFREMRSESKVLQQLYHPCLVCMVGVTVNPTMSLVLEEVPEGSLQSLLVKEQSGLSRIVSYRIAIQVASALHFLHSISIIYRDLKADNVLVWSLSPDHLINCKVANSANLDPGGTRGVHGTKRFVAPEVSRVGHAKEHSVYDYRVDIFSFGMILYQILARRLPFHNLKPVNIEVAIVEGKRPQLEDVPIAEIGLYYMTRITKLCWAGNPIKRPESQQIIEWLSSSALQLIISVIPVKSKYSIRNGCVVTPDNVSNEVGLPHTSSELWICCDGLQGEVIVFTTNTMVEVCRHSVKENQMHSIKQCGQYVWVPSRIDLEYGVVNIFNKTTKDLVHSLKMKENTVSCITNSDDLVYLGTMEGNCFVFPINVADIQATTRPHYVYISENCIDGLALSKTYLWASIRNQIHFLNPKTLEFEGVEKRKQNEGAFVGKLMLSDDGNLMWSAHLGGVILSAWNAHEGTHITDVDVSACAKEQCHIENPQDRFITAMCPALDTVWIGLSSGYIMIFAMNPPCEFLTCFRPYSSYVRFLSASKYPGPCQTEECMMLCGGKMYRPDDSFKDLPDYKGEKGELVDTAGVAVLWEVLPAKYTRQVHYLSKGTAWLDYSTLKKAMKDTGCTDSVQSSIDDLLL